MMPHPATRHFRRKDFPMYRPLLSMPLLPMLLLAAPAWALPGHQDTRSLDRAVAAFTGRGIGDMGGARSVIDARLKLAACPTLALSWRTAAQDAVVVSCTGPEWRLFVPVRMAASAQSPAAVAPGMPIARAARAEPVIKRGDLVTIAAGAAGFSITREGTALADALPGARFPVKVADARGPVQAVAIEAGRATLPGWAE